MTRLRLLVLLAGASTLLAALPALAHPRPAQGGGAEKEQAALVLLADAADAARTLSYTGTQYVGTWRGGAQTSAVLDVRHRPGTGSTVTAAGHAGAVGLVATPELDARLLRLLSDHYDLAVSGDGRCAGRPAHVVEVRRAGVRGDGAVAGRFWLDRTSGLVLRREVYDEQGRRLSSSAFVDLDVDPRERTVPVGVLQPPLDAGRRLDLAGPWPGFTPPADLPGGLQLYDARVREHDRGEVLHLAYSDGLSTLSLFAQRGRVDGRPGSGFTREQVGRTDVWVERAAPERLVWQGHGRVFTLVSDAAPASLRAAVRALPHDAAPSDGLLARLGRGLARLGSWLNPFA